MSWIPWSKDLPRKPEVLRLVRLTGLSRPVVVCLLMEFWSWADEQTDNGFLPELTLDDLSDILPEYVKPFLASPCSQFWLHVCEVGWLDVRADGLYLPNFKWWMGDSAKHR